MKRKISLVILLAMMLCALTACEKSSSQGASDGKVMTATVDEVKDFMLIVKDQGGSYYTVPFDSVTGSKVSASDFEVGDSVKITYTGEATEVDGFTGEIKSLEKE